MHALSTLTVRNLDDTVKAQLRLRAAENGRSMEAEARAILRDALLGAPPARLGSRIHDRFAGLGADRLELPARSELPRAADLGA
ncbi:MAG: Arc family DNA-binding protein [Actinobacteria bacterium]|nr:Arc family DNA-binding protein [Actinomycetota bacterium]